MRREGPHPVWSPANGAPARVSAASANGEGVSCKRVAPRPNSDTRANAMHPIAYVVRGLQLVDGRLGEGGVAAELGQHALHFELAEAQVAQRGEDLGLRVDTLG